MTKINLGIMNAWTQEAPFLLFGIFTVSNDKEYSIAIGALGIALHVTVHNSIDNS